MSKLFENKVINAMKWSTITELIAKLITPLTNMILARILLPDVFGVVATINMIISFVDMFTDSGFQKYLVQHEFSNDEEKDSYANVAFWTNFCFSILFLLIIFIIADYLSILVGTPGLGNVIRLASLALPLTSFSSIQMALYRRDFDFKTLFYIRIIGIMIPFIITIPLAFIWHNCWALIIGNLCGQLANAIILTMKSNWRPKKRYSFFYLKIMFSFSLWSLIEAITIWLTTWIDIFIVGSLLDQYYVGIYQTGISTVNGIMSIITASTTSIIFATLSRLQNNHEQYRNYFLKIQKIVGLIVLPMGIGIYIYRDFITSIMLGDNWNEASFLIGIWGLTSALVIILGHYCSEVYRSKGKPKISVIVQVTHLIFLIPVCYYSAQISFNSLVLSRSLIRLQIIFVHMIFIYKLLKINPVKILVNLRTAFLGVIFMGIFALFFKNINNTFLWNFISISLCVFIYFILIILMNYITCKIHKKAFSWKQIFK